MNPPALPPELPPSVEPPPVPTPAQPEQVANSPVLVPVPRWRRILFFPVKYLVAVALTQSMFGAILLWGWADRLVQRAVLRRWWKQSESRGTQTFAEFCASDSGTAAHRQWPNFITHEGFREGGTRGWLSALFAAFARNLRLGTQALCNTSILLLPAGLLMWFGWYDGWQNSFNKGYENYAVGITISFIGIGWFIAAMFYMPMAQARQAVTGDWRAFWDGRVVRAVARERWLAGLLFAALISLLAVPCNVMKSWPMFQMNVQPAVQDFTDAQALKWLNDYFFACGFSFVLYYVLVRLAGARLYAGGLVAAVRNGRIAGSQLHETERVALERLQLLHQQLPPERPFALRVARWGASTFGRGVAGFALFWLWFSVIAQLYVNEFLHYHVAQGWLNQPLIQLPWFRYIPAKLDDPGGVLALTAALVILISGVGRVGKMISNLRPRAQ